MAKGSEFEPKVVIYRPSVTRGPLESKLDIEAALVGLSFMPRDPDTEAEVRRAAIRTGIPVQHSIDTQIKQLTQEPLV